MKRSQFLKIWGWSCGSFLRHSGGPVFVARVLEESGVNLLGWAATNLKESYMPKYLIEREVPGAGKMTPKELQAISQTSCGVLNKLGPSIQWNESYVTGDKIYCVYIAPNEEMVREHARQGGFPANSVSEVATVIGPTTAE